MHYCSSKGVFFFFWGGGGVVGALSVKWGMV